MRTQPLRLGPFARRRLERLARRDAEAAGQPGSPGASGTPPTIAALQARANAYARREEQRFLAATRRELAEQRILSGDLRTDLEDYDDRLAALPPDQREATVIAEGWGTAFEELRRLQRRIALGHRRSEALAAIIHTRFATARLRASRYYDRSDEKIAVYWGAYRALADPVVERAPELQRSDWLTVRQGALELWHQNNGQGRTDVQA